MRRFYRADMAAIVTAVTWAAIPASAQPHDPYGPGMMGGYGMMHGYGYGYGPGMMYERYGDYSNYDSRYYRGDRYYNPRRGWYRHHHRHYVCFGLQYWL